MYTSTATIEIREKFPQKIKLKRELSYDLDISVLGIDPNDSISTNHTATYAFIFFINTQNNQATGKFYVTIRT